MKRLLLCLLFLATAAALAFFSFCRGVRSGRIECTQRVSDSVEHELHPDAGLAAKFILDAAIRLECSSMEEAADIARDMLGFLSKQPNISIDKDTITGLISAAEKLESRRISLANGASVAAREFDRLGRNDFAFAVNSICALRLFCAKASAKFESVGDVASELWLVYFLTRARTRLSNTADADGVSLLDHWLGEVWSFVDSRESSAYKATKKLWEDGLRRILAGKADDDYCEVFVDNVRTSFIERIAKSGNGHVVPWEGEFTLSALAAKVRAFQKQND